VSDREVRLVAAAQAFVNVTRGGILEQNAYWVELRDALIAYPLQVVTDQKGGEP
jgi:hypothetical protein